MEITDIPILNYHKIEAQSDIGITARHPDDFIKDMRVIKDSGYETITFEDIAGGLELQANHLLISFDDGYESLYHHALPVMKEYHMRGVVYIPVDFIGMLNDWDVQFFGKKYRHLTEAQLIELGNNGFEIASHGLTHSSLTQLEDPLVFKEVVRSKERLEALNQKEVVSFCFPFGVFNADLLTAVHKAGYKYAVSSIHYKRYVKKYRALSLKRFNIYRFDSQKTVLKKIKNNFNSLLAFRDWVFQRGARATTYYKKI